MNNCPHCGAAPMTPWLSSGPHFEWECFSYQYPQTSVYQDNVCRIRELEQRNAKLEIRIKSVGEITRLHNLLAFMAKGNCECDAEVGACPCMSCAANEIIIELNKALDKDPGYTAVKGDSKTYSVKVSGSCDKKILDMRKCNTYEPTEDPDKEPGDE